MKTQKQAVDYALSMIGKGYDFDGAYGYQCFDTANYYWYYLFGHGLKGNGAIDIPTWNNFKGEATVHKNTPNFLAKAGDVVVFNANYGGGYGHVAIIVSANLNTITVVEQNWNGGGANKTEVTTKRTHAYDFPMWFVRPKFKKSTVKEKVKKVTKQKTYHFVVGGEPIITRISKPSLKAKTGGQVKPKQSMTFNKLVKKEGYEWGQLTNYKGQKEYVPIRPLSQKTYWGDLT